MAVWLKGQERVKGVQEMYNAPAQEIHCVIIMNVDCSTGADCLIVVA